MKDVAEQDIHLGDRVACFSERSSVVYVGHVVDILAMTNEVDIEVVAASNAFGPFTPSSHKPIRVYRHRVVVLKS